MQLRPNRNLPLGLTVPLLALGLGALLDLVFTVEWSYPYCSGPDSGPAFAVLGMPLPYQTYSGVSSLQHFFMPHIYAANVLLLAGLVWPVCRLLVKSGKIRAGVLNGIGLVLICLTGALLAIKLHIGWFIPVGSVADGGSMRYQELRPVSVGLSFGASGDCTASKFWFPQGWRPR